MAGERDQCEHCSGNGNHHWPQALDSCIEEGLLERFTMLAPLFNEIEEHNDVADDNADKRDHTEERHEPERSVHDVKRYDRSGHAIGYGCEDESRLHCAPELDHECDI